MYTLRSQAVILVEASMATPIARTLSNRNPYEIMIECYTSLVHGDNNALSTSGYRPDVLSAVQCKMPKKSGRKTYNGQKDEENSGNTAI